MLREKKRDILALTRLQICQSRKEERWKMLELNLGLLPFLLPASVRMTECSSSAGLRHPGESPSPVQWPPDSNACLLHGGLLSHPCGRAHHPHVHLLRQGEWPMSKTEEKRESEREEGRRERDGVESSPGAASKLPRLNIPSLSIKRTVIKWSFWWKTAGRPVMPLTPVMLLLCASRENEKPLAQTRPRILMRSI